MERSRTAAQRIGNEFGIGQIAGFCVAASLLVVFATVPVVAGDACLIVYGLGGLPEYEENFVSWAGKLEALFQEQSDRRVFLVDGRSQGRTDILRAFQELASAATPEDFIWVFLIGHANHNGEHYKFQIRGPDLTDTDLKEALTGLGNRKILLIAATSASGVLLPDLRAENRVVITATKNQYERQPPLFLSFLVEASGSPEADADKNRRVSLLEAFLFSQNKVRSWYSEQGMLQTEHSLLDDQGRFQLEGTLTGSSDVMTGAGMLAAIAYLSAPPESAYRSQEAQDLARERVQIERRIEALKFRKDTLQADEYYGQLQDLLVELATISEKIAQLEGS
jgi:hypothetical protein